VRTVVLIASRVGSEAFPSESPDASEERIHRHGPMVEMGRSCRHLFSGAHVNGRCGLSCADEFGSESGYRTG
jgi:hypothetical protein